ncbi:phage major capsid protein [Gordonia sp. X0973]|uniref:phage major capsid protein n=1 Tax=Gordonia sp. X0973 TaxID=2742602 RepID=UPI000F527F3D|nr:phage major capsid protein [Gordonia sp. X0973]QKT06067.1 phage major capsid protein [Gordonia sp. X0973]
MATIKTGTSPQAWRPDVNTFAPVDEIPEALIVQASTLGGKVEGDAPSVRVAYVTDDDAQFSAEAEVIPESDPVLSEALVHTAKVTQLIKLSMEQYMQPGTNDQLSTSLKRAITKKANEAFLAQVAPTSPAVAPVAGLLNTTGVVAGDEVTTNLDPIVDLIAELEANGATPSLIVLDPVGWAAIRKLKTATGSNESLVGAGVGDAVQQLLDRRVIVSPSMTVSTGLVIDPTEVISAYGDINLATSTDAYFNSDSIAIRATWRLGHVVPRANRLGTFTIEEA